MTLILCGGFTEILLWKIQYQTENVGAADGNNIKLNGRVLTLHKLRTVDANWRLLDFNRQ